MMVIYFTHECWASFIRLCWLFLVPRVAPPFGLRLPIEFPLFLLFHLHELEHPFYQWQQSRGVSWRMGIS